MRLIVLGASGVLGRRIVARLVTEGHEVTGTSRSEERFGAIREVGATPLALDVFDEGGIELALARVQPEVVVNAVSDIPDEIDIRRYADVMAGNDRVRAEGTPILMRAVVDAGVGRVITASIAFAYAPTGGRPATEDDPLHLAPEPFGRTARAVATLERSTLTTEGVRGTVLRFGALYGPGTFYAPDGTIGARVLAGTYPVVGQGDAVTSFIHVDDAARGTSVALTRDVAAVFNIVDDEPARMRDWLPALATAIGGPPPEHRSPTNADAERTTGRDGASNAKARRDLGWSPRPSSWRQGFARQGPA